MKKVILSVLMLFSVLLMTSVVNADETVDPEPVGQTDLTIHFKNWAEDYTDLGTHGWDGLVPKEAHDGIDEFGAKFEFEDVPTTGVAGFIAVLWKNGAQDWGAKQTGDINIDLSELKPGEHNHIYIMEGAATKTVAADPEDEDAEDVVHKGYYLARNDAYNLFLVYADAALTYEDNLGVHTWNGWIDVNPGWGSPYNLFTDGAAHSAVPQIKVGMLHSASMDAGLLIYAGADGNKKTGDVTIAGAITGTYGEDHTPALGDVGVAFVYNDGNGNTSNENLFYDVQEFVLNAFSFKFVEMSVADNGERIGTFAPRPNQVRVEFNSSIALKEDNAEENLELLKEWFTVSDKDGNEVEIEDIHYSGTSVSSFVLILASNLDNTKEYTVSFDLGLEGDENRSATISLDMDTQGPEIIFLAHDWDGVDLANRVIEVEWDKKFDWNLFPGFLAVDDRDGNVTLLVHVPEGEFSKLDTNRVGDYTIMLRVSDDWGNVTEEKFIFRVKK